MCCKLCGVSGWEQLGAHTCVSSFLLDVPFMVFFSHFSPYLRISKCLGYQWVSPFNS